MQLAEAPSIVLNDPAVVPRAALPVVGAILLFAALSSYCAIRSEGFIAGDACIHYFSARHAFSNPKNLVDVWNRPLVTALYAGPAWLGDREAIRVVSMLVAIGCGCVSYWIARGQGLATPALALIFTLGQPMLFLHSFAEMTELPFALLIGSAFLAWQKERFALAALLVSWSPLARPEGFGIVALMLAALLIYRKWLWVLILPIPVILWDVAGWLMSDRALPWWGWLKASWPYAGTSMYASGYLITFVVLLPVVISPFVLPAMLVGWGRSLFAIRLLMRGTDSDGEAPAGPVASHPLICQFLTGAVPLFVLVVHSLLFWLGKMASSGEARYLLVVAPFWGVLSARGWEWIFRRLNWRHCIGWAGAAVLLPPIAANIATPAVPVSFWHDWRTARSMVAWYRASPLRGDHPRIMSSHPGVYYFLGVNPYGSPNVQAWGKQSVRARPADTILIWDPIFGSKNACTELAVELDEIRTAGWIEVDVPKIAEDNLEMPKEARSNPRDPRRYWHVFMSER
ncbi:MAG TPA: hypothetical protein VG326_18495 [Tepidisphaeraceae bacterium]|jgi:hypothetical protein|nr:hypothetical protein [Tepidisphaeraceae bacterium]